MQNTGDGFLLHQVYLRLSGCWNLQMSTSSVSSIQLFIKIVTFTQRHYLRGEFGVWQLQLLTFQISTNASPPHVFTKAHVGIPTGHLNARVSQDGVVSYVKLVSIFVTLFTEF